MIITKLAGGLGNQMFQYAIARALSLDKKTDFKMDLSFLLDRITPREKDFVYREYDLNIFNIQENFATAAEVQSLKKNIFKYDRIDSILKKIAGKKITYFKETYFHFNPKVFSLGSDIYLDGYWQSPKYFQHHENEIRKDFILKNPLSNKATELLERINNCNAVCVNVRRGDFVTNPVHGTIGIDYYKKGEKIISSKINNPQFFVFSDDIKWCENNLRFSETIYVSHEYAGEKFCEYLQLMQSCKHFIIPNSSFGWWAAWLSSHVDKIVIAPKQWFNKASHNTNDLIPAGWMKL